MGSIGAGELILIFLVALLVFGAKRLPEIARGLGQGIREFKNATREITREFDIEPPRTYVPAQNALPRRDPSAAFANAPSQAQGLSQPAGTGPLPGVSTATVATPATNPGEAVA